MVAIDSSLGELAAFAEPAHGHYRYADRNASPPLCSGGSPQLCRRSRSSTALVASDVPALARTRSSKCLEAGRQRRSIAAPRPHFAPPPRQANTRRLTAPGDVSVGRPGPAEAQRTISAHAGNQETMSSVTVPTVAITSRRCGIRGLPSQILKMVCRSLAVRDFPAFRRVASRFRDVMVCLLSEDRLLKAALHEHMRAIEEKIRQQKVWVGIRVRPHADNTLGWVSVRRNSITSNAVESPSRRYSAAGAAAAFTFDRVFGPAASQKDIWSMFEAPAMGCLSRQESACIFAYGQTGSGKTHSMFGAPVSPEDEGVTFRAVRCVGALLRKLVAKDRLPVPIVRFSFVELYNEAFYDLLDDQRAVAPRVASVRLRPDRLPSRECSLDLLEEEVFPMLVRGSSSRTVGKTVLNDRSSRSHAIATLHIQWPQEGEAPMTEKHLHLVDLAGSERAGQYALDASQLKEGCNINLSLSTLGRVVKAMTDGHAGHVPFRDSALTWLLQDSILGIGGRAFLLATVNPAHPAETLSTLQYARQYSVLKTDSIHRLNLIVKERVAKHGQVNQARLDLLEECGHHRGPSTGQSHWTEALLRAPRVVRLINGARRGVQSHPAIEFTAEHIKRAMARDCGIVPGDVVAHDAGDLLDVRFMDPGATDAKSVKKGLVLRYPAAVLQDLDKPGDLIGKLGTLLAREEELKELREKVHEEQQRINQEYGLE